MPRWPWDRSETPPPRGGNRASVGYAMPLRIFSQFRCQPHTSSLQALSRRASYTLAHRFYEWLREMIAVGRGSYLGGSTIIGPWSGWMSTRQPHSNPKKKTASRKGPTEPPKPSAKRMRKAELAEQRAKKMAKQAALRKIKPPRRSPDEIAQRLGQRMLNVEVAIRRADGTLRITKRKGRTIHARTKAD